MPTGSHPNSRKNLKSKKTLTHEEAVKMGRAGGKKSGEVRSEMKIFREQVVAKLSAKHVIKDEITGRKKIKLGVCMIVDAQFDKAIKGDTGAANFLRDTSGEKPVDKVEQTNLGYKELSEPEQKALLKEALEVLKK